MVILSSASKLERYPSRQAHKPASESNGNQETVSLDKLVDWLRLFLVIVAFAILWCLGWWYQSTNKGNQVRSWTFDCVGFELMENALAEYMAYPFHTDEAYQVSNSLNLKCQGIHHTAPVTSPLSKQGIASMLADGATIDPNLSPNVNEEALLRMKVFYFNRCLFPSNPKNIRHFDSHYFVEE